MFVGVVRIELHIPASGSLKSKRHVVKGLIGGLRSTFNVAVAEVEYQDLWQRTTLGVSCVSEAQFGVRKVLHEVERWVSRDDRVEIISSDPEIYSHGDD